LSSWCVRLGDTGRWSISAQTDGKVPCIGGWFGAQGIVLDRPIERFADRFTERPRFDLGGFVVKETGVNQR
jgi:hypothetical protein